MNKSLAAILIAAACLMPARANDADVLVWYVDTEEDAASYDGATREFDTIKFWAIDSDTGAIKGLAGNTYTGPNYLLNKTPAAGSGDTITLPGDAEPPTTIHGTYYTDLSGYATGYTFQWELYQGDTLVDRMLTPLTWGDLATYMVSSLGIEADLNLALNTEPYNAASTMVPEPSSGLLLLVGGALLALRRRRRSPGAL